MRKARLSRLALLASALLPFVVWGAEALARPGGGQSFGGGGGGGGGGGSGGGGGGGLLLFWLFELVLRLCIQVPIIGIPLLVVLIFVFVRALTSGALANQGWSTGPGANVDQPPFGLASSAASQPPPRRAIEALLADDPAFSLPLFEDFLTALYTQVQEARGAHTLETLSPYLDAPVRTQLAQESSGLTEVREVIVGGQKLVAVSGLTAGSDRVSVQVRFEVNYAEVRAAHAQTYWAVELWTLERKRSARSRPPSDPGQALDLKRCPSCGAPLDGLHDGVCSYCRKTIDSGDFDWFVTGVATLEKAKRLPVDSSDPGPLPDTVRDGDAQENLDTLIARDPQFDWESFANRVGAVFAELQVAWSTLKWDLARSYVSDSLFRAQSSRIALYQREGLRNVTANTALERAELVSCTSDAVYDSITVRIYADGLDYTLDERTQRVVEGSQTRVTHYSEYWTLLRGRGVKGKPSAAKTCPSCGAPLNVNMAGDCTYCRAHLTSGEFDWVLSRIEQDSAYE